MRKRDQLRFLLLTGALATGCFGPSSCRQWQIDTSFEDLDASDGRAQALLRLAQRPGRAEQGFSDLPARGNLSLATPKPFRRPEKGWEKISIGLIEFRTCSSRDWQFMGGEGARALAWESERYRGARAYRDRSESQDDQPYLEAADLLFAARDFSTTGREEFRSSYYGRFGDREVPRELVKKLGRAWACLPIPEEEPAIPVPALSSPNFDVAELAASATFSGVELYGWKSSGSWAFALVQSKAPKGRSPLVLAAGVTLEELLPVLSEVPHDSAVRWTGLSIEEEVADGSSLVSPAHEQIRTALLATGSTLTP